MDNAFSSLYSDKMNFSNANNLGDVAQQIKTGNYLNATNPTGSYMDSLQFGSDFGSTGGTNSNWLSKEGILGGTDKFGNKTGGWAMPALSLLESGLGFYLGKGQLDQAEDSLAESKRQFNTNYNAQKTLVNDQLNWQYNSRKASNPNYDGELAQIT